MLLRMNDQLGWGQVLLSAALLIGPAHTQERAKDLQRPGWARVVVVDEPNEEDPLLEEAFNQVTAEGVDDKFAASVIGDLNHHIDSLTDKRKSAELCLGMVVDAVEATSASKWTARDASRLLIALQDEMDKPERPSTEFFQALVAEVRRGQPASKLLDMDGRLIPLPGRSWQH